ncbi:MFS transporter [Saccharothrix sp. Mg75]|uniref:MFS transporter n=1 Tax=Saccharothrix sp. Mg75 TaxID=3445357 RepID=UPI003EEE3A11
MSIPGTGVAHPAGGNQGLPGIRARPVGHGVGDAAGKRCLVGYRPCRAPTSSAKHSPPPYAAHLNGGPVAVGMLFAAYSIGAAAASLAVAALPDPLQHRLMPLLASGTGVPLPDCLADPPLPVVVALFALSGAASGYHVVANPSFMLRAPDTHRGQTVGFAITTMQATQGAGVAPGGLATEVLAPHLTTAAAGAVGVLAATALATRWRALHHPDMTSPA